MTQWNAPTTPARTSGMAIASFILGILGLCIPVLGGLVAIILGLAGFVATGKPGVKGRWAAVTGLILGFLSLCGYGSAGGLMYWAWRSGQPMRIAAHDFVAAAAAGDLAAARAHATTDMSDQDIADASAHLTSWGTFRDTTFFASTTGGGSSTLGGVAMFNGTGGPLIQVDMKLDGGIWKVRHIDAPSRLMAATGMTTPPATTTP